MEVHSLLERLRGCWHLKHPLTPWDKPGELYATDLPTLTAYLERTSQERPGDMNIRMQLATAYIGGGEEDRGLAMLQEIEAVARQLPESQHIRLNLAFAYIQAVSPGNFHGVDRAKAVLQGVLSEEPSASTAHIAHMQLANALSLGGDQEQALREMRESIRLAPDEPIPYLVLGMMLRPHGDLPGAADAFREAVRLSKGRLVPAYFRLADTLKDLGERGAARDAWTKAIKAGRKGPLADRARQMLQEYPENGT